MTFNIRGSHHKDGVNAWKRRADLNVRVIQRCAPDLIGFQELQDGNRRFYEAQLPGYERRPGPEYENREPHSHNAIYWNPRRFRLLDAGGFWLSETPEKFSRSWESHQVRSVNWVRLRMQPEGVDLIHLNTHLDHKSENARVEGSRSIARTLIRRLAGDAPVLLTGDFNCDPGSEAYEIFARQGFSDAHLSAGNEPANTFHRFAGGQFEKRNPQRELRMDWLLLRDGSNSRWAVRSCRIVRDAEPPVYPSDHYPVISDLQLDAFEA